MRDWKAVERSGILRRGLTPHERKLWHRLNRRQLAGIKFRRQAAIGPYIADFLSHDAMLVVELDGDTHAAAEQARRDARRTRFLEARGFRVVRFFNSEIRENLDDVVRRIRLACGLGEYPGESFAPSSREAGEPSPASAISATLTTARKRIRP